MYPGRADFEPHHSHLANFLWGSRAPELSQRLILGNGASELIDILTRDAAAQGSPSAASPTQEPRSWCPGPSSTQYKEYSRSAHSAGFVEQAPGDDGASLVCIVNPSNPTGDYMPLADLQSWIEARVVQGRRKQQQRQQRQQAAVHVLVDESMLMWLGSAWSKSSLSSQQRWLEAMAADDVHIFTIHSWTKLWACPGLRLGSCVCPTDTAASRIRSRQVPWSVNSPALAFLTAAVRDSRYLDRTWELTPEWNRAARDALRFAFPDWTVHGPPWASWLWVDTGSTDSLERALALARSVGLPIRSGAAGYDSPTCFRMAVRSPEISRALVDALGSGSDSVMPPC